MLTLYHYWSSVCSQKVRLCLAEKNIPFESKHIDLFTFEHWEPFYRKINQKGVVPALDHDGKIIIESNVILEYLDDCFPAIRLRPEDHYAKAQMRIWIFNSEEIAHYNVNTCSHNPRHAVRLAQKPYTQEQLDRAAANCPNPIIMARFLHRLKHGVSEAEENAAYTALDYLLGMMDDALAQGPWIAGKEYSLADIAMAPFINRIEVLKRPEMVGDRQAPAPRRLVAAHPGAAGLQGSVRVYAIPTRAIRSSADTQQRERSMGETISLTAEDGHNFEAYRADPAGKPKSGVVVVQEIYGVNEHIRSVCDDYAARGYRAIAPSVYDRQQRGAVFGYDGAEIQRIRALRAGIDWQKTLPLDIAATIAALRPLKVGAVGYCLGGSVAWMAACRLGVEAASCYYPTDMAKQYQDRPRVR